MKTSKIIAAAALSLLAAAGAQAETYEGVHPLVSSASRADVKAEAVAAARSDNPYAEAVSSRVAPVQTASTDRAGVRVDAVAAARSANPYAEGYAQGVNPVLASTVDRATVRAEARAAARGIDQLAL
ncbi:helicase SNF2 [Variovorax paradoxus]|nr:helicase SNF2 [Variovorax paradoxus]